MFVMSFSRIRGFAAASILAVMAACAAPPPPPPAPPPPPEPIPARPMAPGGAADNMPIPFKGVDGVRQTVNANVTPAQATWNMRSAFVVGSLNCLDPRYAQILESYKLMLKAHEKALGRTNTKVEGEWKQRIGTGYQRARDTYTTKLYNYFALPPALPRFCDAMLEISREAPQIASADLDAFSMRALSKVENSFELFFQEFEQYRIAAAAWDAKYGAQYGAAAVPVTSVYGVPASTVGGGPVSYGPSQQPQSTP